MKIKRFEEPIPVGNSILVEVSLETDEKLGDGTIVIPKEYTDRRIASTCEGRVISIGPDAFIHTEASEPYCYPNDLITFVQNAGIRHPHKDERKEYRILAERDIKARVGQYIEE